MKLLQQLTDILPPNYRQLWIDYCRYIELGWHHFLREYIPSEVKKEKLRLLDKALRREFQLYDSLIRRLQQEFLQENISISLLLEPLTAWSYLSEISNIKSEQQLTAVVNMIMAPAARLFMVLKEENPSTYLPMTSFMNAYAWLYLGQSDFMLLRKLRITQVKQIRKILGLLENAQILLAILRHKKLKFCLAWHLNTIQWQINAWQNNKQYTFSLLDRLRIFWYSCLQLILVRHQSVTKRGL